MLYDIAMRIIYTILFIFGTVILIVIGMIIFDNVKTKLQR